MVYLSAKHIAIKKDQDRTFFDRDKIILCDGIGEFKDSAKAAEILIDNLITTQSIVETRGMIEKSVMEIITSNLIAGTTYIMATLMDDNNKLALSYIGNGGIIKMQGDFYELPKTYSDINKPYRYLNLMMPHIDRDGILVRHVSHQSNPEELIPSNIDITLDGINGDIVIICTDGITSLEDDFIVADDQSRLWRNQSGLLSKFIEHLHDFLKANYAFISNQKIEKFIELELNDFKENKLLEDDASVGVILTEEVINYYKTVYHAK
ncbi:MAG: hypothetical protein IPP64_11625 [Bacteroidetes bacterium]|nr:hypothetical protein [Bacteroidota bacterium]